MSNGDKPAYPVHGGYDNDDPRNGTIGGGLTKLELVAAMCLGHAVDKWYNHSDEELVARSIKLSKELLRQLDHGSDSI